MKKFSSRLGPSVATAVVVAAVIATGGTALAREHHAHAKAATAKAPTFWTPGDLKWTEVPGMQGITTAALWGEEAKGPHGTLHKFAAGKVVPLHSHKYDSKYVVVAGTWVNAVEGGPEKELPVGSYALMPGGVMHTTRCKEGADCIIILVQGGPWDVTMAEAAAPAK